MEDDKPSNAQHLICCTTTAQHVHVSWPETVTPEGYAEQLWNAPQYPHHNNKIWKLWQCRCPCSPGHHSPGPFVTRPHYGHMRKWIIWQIQWGTQYSPSLGWITRSILATSGLTCPLGTCHPPTTYIEELTQLTDRLHHLTMTLQPHPAPSLKKNLYTQLCKHTQTPGMPHRERQTSPHSYSKISPHSMDKTPKS